ncbi:MAG: hypothetical protein ACJ705_02565 [Nitrososphaeraceae archaeon]
MMFAVDGGSERATSIEDYQNTCSEFITDISKDYKDWVDRYQLSEEESKSRKASIDNIVQTTNDWIFKYADTIKKVDIIMNDGVNKMAENTAGYPFKFDVFVNNMIRYANHPIGEVRLNVRATPRDGRLARIGNYGKDQLFLINSSSQVNFTVSPESLKGVDILSDYIVIDAKNCRKYDVISITVLAEEVSENSVMESRGYTTLILLL